MKIWHELDTISTSVIYCDCAQADMPIVYVNEAFESQTGYQADEIIGKNCRFLQGVDTDPEAVASMRKAIKAGQGIQLTLLNYRKDGSAFWNEIELSPIRDASGLITHYVSLQKDVTNRVVLELERDKTIRELQHRLRNMFSVIMSVTRNSSSDDMNAESFKQILFDRLEALAKANAYAHNQFFHEDNLGFEVIHLFHSQVLSAVNPNQVSYADNKITVSANEINNIGLVLNELIHLSSAFGALSYSEGQVDISWHQEDELSVMAWSETCQGAQKLTDYDGHFAAKLIQTINTMNQFDAGVFDHRKGHIHCVIGFRNKT